MLAILWNLSAAIRACLRHYLPTNRAVDWLRIPRLRWWTIPVAIAATAAYLGLTAACIELTARPGLGFLNILVLLFFWNAMKFASLSVLSPFLSPAGRPHRSSWRSPGA